MRKSEWVTGHELVERWQIVDFELFKYLKMGLQAYTTHGKKIVALENLEQRPVFDSIDDAILEIEKELERARNEGIPNILLPSPKEIETMAKKALDNIKVPDSSSDVIVDFRNFSLPNDLKKAHRRINAAMEMYVFKLEDVKEFEKKNGFPEQEKEPLANTNRKQRDFDEKLLSFAERKRKKNPRLTIPDIAREALKNQEDFLYSLNPQSRKLPKQETVEKHLRKAMKSARS